jgi:hypothetical protein
LGSGNPSPRSDDRGAIGLKGAVNVVRTLVWSAKTTMSRFVIECVKK